MIARTIFFTWKKIFAINKNVPNLLTMTLTTCTNQYFRVSLHFINRRKESVCNTRKMDAKICPEIPEIERSSCIFCNIVNKLENTEIIFEDEEVCVFRDIKPASDYHILTVPKRHIEDAKCLASSDKDLVEKMLATAKELLSKNNLSLEDARFGYHWPPFRSVRHLHLHTIAPESKMGYIGKMIFKKDSYWFVSPEYVASRL